MKTLKLKERIYDSFVEQYELDGIYAGRPGVRPGLLACYLLAELPDAMLESFFGDEEGEPGSLRNMIRLDGKAFHKNFPSWDIFLEQMIEAGIQTWEISLQVSGISLRITGQTWRAVIGIIYPATKTVQLMPLLAKVENESFGIHGYDNKLVETVKKLFHLNQKSAIRTLDKLKCHKDLFDEFQSGCKNTVFEFPENGIRVLDYDAEILCKRYPLTELGAYQYLIYLRENPDEALKDLKKGLPNK